MQWFIMEYYIWTIGCQYNEWDGARIRYILDSLDFQEVKKLEEAEIIIVLACAVRQTAVDRILGRVNTLRKKLLSSGNCMPTIIVTGCVLENDKKKFREKDLKIIPAGDYKTLIKSIDPYKKILPSALDISRSNSRYIPIMTGCNNFCSYCAVPYTRGREKSRPIKEILNDAKKIIEKGEKNIILLGQNVNSFRISNNELRVIGKKDFSILLEKLNALPGDFKISFTSNHPKDMTEDIVEAVAILPKIKKEIHLPLQSGSNKILKAMNRPYTKEKYLSIVKQIRKCEKKYDIEIDILTDVIVGFPGETEKDFQETVNIFKKVGYKQAFVNKYSPRVGTAAYKLGDPIPWSEKQRRWRILNDIANK